MIEPISEAEYDWISTQIAGLSLKEKVAQLMCPNVAKLDLAYWQEQWQDVQLGCLFFPSGKKSDQRAIIDFAQQSSKLPVLVAADMEHGFTNYLDAVDFPHLMACAAADDAELVRQMGAATAQLARREGFHWTFSPVVDINFNRSNPVTNIRSFGDDPAQVAKLGAAFVEGLQEGGRLAATAKHFPGDGVDDRDQHLCTSVNSLTVEQWWETYGVAWKAVIEAGLLTVMPGHISFPHYTDQAENPRAAMPATLCPHLSTSLLREELGFSGVIVSDAAPMIGLASRAPKERLPVDFIKAGGDVYLFSAPEDIQYVLNAVESGALTEERINESVYRVLELKVKLNLVPELRAAPVGVSEVDAASVATAIAEKSLCIETSDTNLPKSLPEAAKVLTVTLKEDFKTQHMPDDLYFVDTALRARGYDVEHVVNPSHRVLMESEGIYERVFVNIMMGPHAKIGNIRMCGHTILPLWRSFWVNTNNAVFTAFGSPYVSYELPHLPNLLHAFSASPYSQEAAVKVWLGEMDATGLMPVHNMGHESLVPH